MIYLIRHGQTEWNKNHKLQGATDVPLNENGRQMARDARETVRGLQLDVCYVSPLQRAAETAEILLEGIDIPVITDSRLQELSFGHYEGGMHLASDPDSPIYDLFHTPELYDAEGKTESFEDLYKRTKSFIDEIIIPSCKEGKNLLIVAHGALNLSLYNQLYQIPLERFWENLLNNCEVCGIPDEIVLNHS